MLVRVNDYFSFSHWGMFRLPLATCPDWFAAGLAAHDENLDDDLYEDICPKCGTAFRDDQIFVRCDVELCPMKSGGSLLDRAFAEAAE